MGGRWPVVTEAVDPTLIKWTNLGVSKQRSRWYTCITDLSAIFLLLISFYALAYLTKKKVETKGKENQVIVFGLVLILAIINAGLRTVLGLLSNFEGKHTETERLQSAVSRMWIVQYLNGALILLLI